MRALWAWISEIARRASDAPKAVGGRVSAARDAVGRRVSDALDAADRRVAPATAIARIAGAIAVLVLVIFLVSGPATLAAPRTCASCHSSDYRQWASSRHASVACASCHSDRAAALGLGNSVALLSDLSRVGSGPGGVVAVPDTACLRCHSSQKLFRKVVTASGLRMSHKGLIGRGHRCIDCHADVAHAVPAARATRPTMSSCATCHNNVDVTGACTTCHAESASKIQAREVDPEWSKTHGPDWKTLHGMGDLSTCTLCHARTECQTCHGVPMPHEEGFISTHGATAQQHPAACITCHQQTFCSDCHGIQMPHPAGFLKQHPTTAKQPGAPCMRCHTQDNCDQCHQAHIHANGLGGSSGSGTSNGSGTP